MKPHCLPDVVVRQNWVEGYECPNTACICPESDHSVDRSTGLQIQLIYRQHKVVEVLYKGFWDILEVLIKHSFHLDGKSNVSVILKSRKEVKIQFFGISVLRLDSLEHKILMQQLLSSVDLILDSHSLQEKLRLHPFDHVKALHIVQQMAESRS